MNKINIGLISAVSIMGATTIIVPSVIAAAENKQTHVISCVTKTLSITKDTWQRSDDLPTAYYNFVFASKIPDGFKFETSIESQKQTDGLYKEDNLAKVACKGTFSFIDDKCSLGVYFTDASPLYLNTTVEFILKIVCKDQKDNVIWTDYIPELKIIYNSDPYTNVEGAEQNVKISPSQERDKTVIKFHVTDSLIASWNGALIDPETGDIIHGYGNIETHSITSLTEKYIEVTITWNDTFIKKFAPGDKFSFYFATQPKIEFMPESPAFLCSTLCTMTMIK